MIFDFLRVLFRSFSSFFCPPAHSVLLFAFLPWPAKKRPRAASVRKYCSKSLVKSAWGTATGQNLQSSQAQRVGLGPWAQLGINMSKK